MVNKADFTKETIEDMKSLTKKTKDVEMGFVFCRKGDDKISSGEPICVGEYCSVDTGKSKCKNNEEDIGSFHTHPTNDIASAEDLVSAMDQEVMCVGRKTLNPFPPFNNRVDCYVAKDKNQREYANKIIDDLNYTRVRTLAKLNTNQISRQEFDSILNNEHDKSVKKLLPLFHTFKI